MNIIRKARIAANKRSIDAYGRSVELAIATHLLDTGSFPSNLASLQVEYTGKTVICNVMQMKENGGLYMSECTVGNKEVHDDTDDGWYHYGVRDLTNEEYVDMYGNALKEASLAYYQEHQSKVADYTTLTVDYTGKKVSCDVTVNYDGTIYMTNCTVAKVSVADANEEDGYYHYGEIKPYPVGHEISYNNVDYFVIKDTKDDVTLLKKTPLTVEEVNTYGGVGTEDNHVNQYINTSQGTAYNRNGYGGMQYYSSPTCGYVNNNWVYDGCLSAYVDSGVKYVVDAWKTAEAKEASEARLITYDELTTDLGCANNDCKNLSYNWLYNSKYWTMTPWNNSVSLGWYVGIDGGLSYIAVCNNYFGVVRPVIVLSKSAL